MAIKAYLTGGSKLSKLNSNQILYLIILSIYSVNEMANYEEYYAQKKLVKLQNGDSY